MRGIKGEKNRSLVVIMLKIMKILAVTPIYNIFPKKSRIILA
jgi:hypothetical protein